ncbi:efflux RND transporter permease subunit [Paradevosia shaoguanensis]|uniref:Efflux RND transporter permease subunit n=1 Tax=Paradevosia shaoguanensis TaxID=1335043 RepID=A0AA41UAF2_9HYPH|nr:efflux RND transporter permease subunit [Paradevosia shaoguanensis]MCF1741827.1 efflux RND transporter permease subunit [Paradevosia shaoguanensis]MCI0126310.1 efflux RND transporter permease subunit [Paradevosia shaoguanensis]
MLDFIERILRMPRVVLTIMALLMIAGFGAYTSLPKESFPAIDIPYFYVSVSQTGVSPYDAERLLAKPIEDRIKDLDGLENYSTTSTTGHASVFLEFNVNADKDKALADIRAKLDGVTGDLPTDATTPTVTEISFSGMPSLSVALYGSVPERALVEKAKDLKKRLEEIPDVQSVTISGARDEMLAVTIDTNRLEAYGLTAAQLMDALAKNNMVVPGGTLDTGKGAFNVEVPGLITNAADVYSLPLKTDGNTVVTFGDVATVQRTFKDATEYAHVNGQPAITLGVVKKLGTNVISISDEVRKVTSEFTASWPDGIEHSFLVDQADSTKSLYRSLEAAVLTAVALVMITCVATLGIRPAIMIGTSIPISFMIAFLVVQLMGMTVNMMIMFGLVLAVGVLVDDPIVVVEYAERKLAEGYDKKEAFIMAARKMFVPVVSATFTTLGAFIPLLFWPGIIGKFMSYLPIIVIVVMVASLVSALIFMPVIGGIIARAHIDEEEKEAADIVMYPDKFDLKKVRGFSGHYVRLLSVLLHYPLITLPVGLGIIAVIFGLYITHPTGMEAFPASEPEFGTVNVIARGNYSPVEIRDLLVEVETQILQVPGIQDSIMTFAGSGGNMMGSSAPPDTIGQFNLQLLPWNDRVKAEEIFANIRERTKDIPGLQVQIAAQENGPPAGKAINLRVESTNYADLAPAVAKLRNFIENDLGDTVDVEDGRPSPGIDWEVTIDRAEAAKYGIGVRELSPYVQLVTSGVKLGTYRPDDATDELDIRVRLPQDERTFDTLDNLRIMTTAGLVPVSNFIERKAVPKVANIQRRNGVYVMNVAANLLPGVATDQKIEELKAWQAKQEWPSTINIAYGGAEEQIGDTNAFIVQAFGMAMFLIFFVLLLEYNSFYQVLVTLSTVIMSLAGVLLGMLVTGMSFSAIMTGLGIVALAGIVVKNGIVLIDTYNHYRRDDDVEPVKAMLLTAAQRVRPVLLTATVTALGVIPMALNIEFDFIRREIVVGGLAGSWFVHLSAALVSGLFFSTALTLIMVPTMITAPHVIKHQLGWVGTLIGRGFGALLSPFRRREVAETPEGVAVEIPPDADSAKKYIRTDGNGLVETEKDGVTIVSRQDAAE